MSKAMLNIYMRTISRRMEKGEELGDILESYPRIGEYQKNVISNELLKNGVQNGKF